MHDVAAANDTSVGIDVVGIFTSALFIDGDSRSVGFDGDVVGIFAQEFVPDRCYKAIGP
jgi:hypothetical protein